jgi:glyoxylase-like metal-dependent hydrolase (beta-lactamase superfamily II)
MIIEQLPVGAFQANCYVVGCEETGSGLIIDPGDEAERILQTVKQHRLTITHVLLTHAHYDHIYASAEIAEATAAPVYLHQADQPLLKAGGGAALWGLPMPRYKEPDHWLVEGDQITVGRYTFQVFFTPGHAPGHVCFYEAAAGVVFAGDVLFAGSIGRTDLPGGSFETLIDSINRKLMTLPDETVVYAGHGPATTIGQERLNNPFL